ncbi:MAG: type II toxin-antitoxin system RelE/ParE family toxin [Proteobacteria bacterium]|nr:type II toxin-antitoxin system RelE/ParE family toxin [Pseudomonadota bacterium]
MSECEVNTDRVRAYLDSLSEKDGDKVVWLSEQLEKHGRDLPRQGPWAKVIKESRHQPELLELRVNMGASVIRIAYYIDTEANIAYLLWGGNKKGQNEKRFYKRLIRESDRAIDSIKEGNQQEEK